MERLSVTTAMVGLLAVGGKTIDLLWDLDIAPETDSAFINQALQAVKQCRLSIHVLYTTLSMMEKSQLPFPERPSWIQLDNIIAVLTDCVLAFSEIQAIAEFIDEQADALDFAAIQQQYGSELSTLCSRLRWLNLSVTMMMTILKCPGESDARSSRAGLDQRVTRLLTSNSQLSGRMRGLQQAFSHIDLRRSGDSGHEHPHGADSSSRSDGSCTPPDRIWSVYTGYTLSDIPVLSIIALPVMTDEVRDGSDFYTFAFAKEVSEDIGLLMHVQTGPETMKMRMRPANTVSETRPRGDRKKWSGLSSAVKILSRKRRRKRAIKSSEGECTT